VAKNKIRKFNENLTFPNLMQIEYLDLMEFGCERKGKWSAFFKNENPIILELGCGKGEYTIGLAQKHPENNYIGVDVKGARIWRGAKSAEELELANTSFIRTKIEEIEHFFYTHEISEIWVTFPDPQPKSYKERKRLISQRFLDVYKKFLSPNGIIHLKTDNLALFEYCLEVIEKEGHKLIESTKDLYNSDIEEEVKSIQTFYENQYLMKGVKINYLKFQLHV
jgi:tRNA (guanine-N7-)-methyltransferase